MRASSFHSRSPPPDIPRDIVYKYMQYGIPVFLYFLPPTPQCPPHPAPPPHNPSIVGTTTLPHPTSPHPTRTSANLLKASESARRSNDERSITMQSLSGTWR